MSTAMAQAHLAMNARGWDEEVYRRGILWGRDLSCRTLFCAIFFDHSNDPDPDVLLAAASTDGSLSSCISSASARSQPEAAALVDPSRCLLPRPPAAPPPSRVVAKSIVPLAHHRLLSRQLQSSAGAPPPCNPVLQNTFGTLPNHAKNSMVSSVRGAGATVAPALQTMFGTMAGPSGYPGMSSVVNAGKLASHVPTPGAPIAGTMFGVPLSQTVFGCLTSPTKNSRVSLMTNAGPCFNSSKCNSFNVKPCHLT